MVVPRDRQFFTRTLERCYITLWIKCPNLTQQASRVTVGVNDIRKLLAMRQGNISAPVNTWKNFTAYATSLTQFQSTLIKLSHMVIKLRYNFWLMLYNIQSIKFLVIHDLLCLDKRSVCLSVCLLSVYISARQSTKVTVRSFTLLKDCFMCLSVYLA